MFYVVVANFSQKLGTAETPSKNMLCDLGLGAEVSFFIFFLGIFFHVLLQQRVPCCSKGRAERGGKSFLTLRGALDYPCVPSGAPVGVFCCFLGKESHWVEVVVHHFHCVVPGLFTHIKVFCDRLHRV